jgi:cystathionine beta-lyase
VTTEAQTEIALLESFDAIRREDLWRSQRIKWRRYGKDVLPAWVAEMDYPVAPPIRQVLVELIERSDLGYHHLPLSPRLRAALVARMADCFEWSIEPRRVLPLVNVVQGLDASIVQHSLPGEGVIVQTPIYPPFLAAVTKSGRRLDACPLVEGDGRFEIDFDSLRRTVRSDTRVFLLCHPHNPTGRVFDASELAGLAEFALDHDLIVVSDEIHADLAFSEHAHRPFASLGPEIAERTLTLTSASKAFNLPGLHCAFAICGGDRAEQPLRTLPPHLLGYPGILADAATVTAWTEGRPWLDAVRATLHRNRDTLIERLAREMPELQMHAPEATFLAWIDCRKLGCDDPHGFFLEHAKVALSDGREFGAPGQGFVRLNFATSAGILADILDRMATALREHRLIGDAR